MMSFFIWTCLVSRLYLMQCGEGFVVNNLSNLSYKVTQLWPITARYSHSFSDKVITDVHMSFPSTISKYKPAIKMKTIKNIKWSLIMMVIHSATYVSGCGTFLICKDPHGFWMAVSTVGNRANSSEIELKLATSLRSIKKVCQRSTVWGLRPWNTHPSTIITINICDGYKSTQRRRLGTNTNFVLIYGLSIYGMKILALLQFLLFAVHGKDMFGND